MEKKLICIVCPLGCEMSVVSDGNAITAVSGNTCPRGKKYAIEEFSAPMRTVTSTVRCEDGSVVSVRTASPISKSHMFDCMKIINSTVAHLPIHIGEVIIKDVFGTDVVATQNKE